MATDMPHCDTCGRFHKAEPGSSWKMTYSGWPLEPDHEITRCLQCTKTCGPLEAQYGIVPAYGAGIV